MKLLLHNLANRSIAVTLRDNAYKSAAVTKTISAQQEQLIQLPLQSSHGWYDFSVLNDRSNAESRYASRAETAQPSSAIRCGGIA